MMGHFMKFANVTIKVFKIGNHLQSYRAKLQSYLLKACRAQRFGLVTPHSSCIENRRNFQSSAIKKTVESRCCTKKE